jgi:competence protein ComEA
MLFRPVAILLLAIFANQAAFSELDADQKPGPVTLVNINTATRTELIQIPRLGEKMAERIVEFRKAHGPFKRIEELMNVKGMGEKTFLSIKHHLTVGSKGDAKQNQGKPK